MTTTQLAALIGKRISILDARTGLTYPATIDDVKLSFGTVRTLLRGVQGQEKAKWFEPTKTEMDSVA